MTPESTICPVREMALKYISSPTISAAMNARSVSNPFAVMPEPPVDVARPQLAPRPHDEVRDPLLRLHALVEVVVAGEHDAHVVLHEERLEHFAQAESEPCRSPDEYSGWWKKAIFQSLLDALSSFSSHSICSGTG